MKKNTENENNISQSHFGSAINHYMPPYIPPSSQIGLHQDQINNQVNNQNRQLHNNNNQHQLRQNQAQSIINNQIQQPLVQPPIGYPPLPQFIPPSPTVLNISNNNENRIQRNIPQIHPPIVHNIRPPIHIPPSHFDYNPQITKMLEEIELTEDMLNKNNEKECVICLEQFSPGDVISYLPCFHFYHYICIKSWIENKSKCPLCNSEIKF